jgi:cupin superfamily protein
MRSVSPLATWFRDATAVHRFRTQTLGRRAVVLPPRDRAWRAIAPTFESAIAMAAAGLPFQIAADRRYDRDADPRRLRPALAAGKTIFMPQIHEVLPRLMRLMVALRSGLLGPYRDECSFLFAVQGRGRDGMGLHHDGEVDAFWLQLDGRRTLTLGPPVPPATPEDMDDAIADAPRDGWTTLDLEPGALLHLPPRTPHRVVCHGRSLALSLTWGPPRRRRRRDPQAAARALTAWNVVSGRVAAVPPRSRRWLWTQVPVATARSREASGFVVYTADGERFAVPRATYRLATRLALMPRLSVGARSPGSAVEALVARGILGERELPLRIVPDDPRRLDGWRFA